VLHSFSWSVNIVGRKRWWMLPPEAEAAVCGGSGGDTSGSVSSGGGTVKEPITDLRLAGDRGEGAAAAGYPGLHSLLGGEGAEAATLLDFEQGEDEVLFVPSGWWHQVLNCEETLSINHNWINAANIGWSWAYLTQQRAHIARTVPGCAAAVVSESDRAPRGTAALSPPGDDDASEAHDEEAETLAQELLELKFEMNYSSFLMFLSEARDRLELPSGAHCLSPMDLISPTPDAPCCCGVTSVARVAWLAAGITCNDGVGSAEAEPEPPRPTGQVLLSSQGQAGAGPIRGESKRLLVESPWSQFTSECQRF
jgi:hypothetical protein